MGRYIEEFYTNTGTMRIQGCGQICRCGHALLTPSAVEEQERETHQAKYIIVPRILITNQPICSTPITWPFHLRE